MPPFVAHVFTVNHVFPSLGGQGAAAGVYEFILHESTGRRRNVRCGFCATVPKHLWRGTARRGARGSIFSAGLLHMFAGDTNRGVEEARQGVCRAFEQRNDIKVDGTGHVAVVVMTRFDSAVEENTERIPDMKPR